MTTSALMIAGKVARRARPRAAFAAPCAPAWPEPPGKGLWPPVAYDIAAYRAEAHRLRAQAITELLTAAWHWLQGKPR
jgi:hypothetical protein